MRAAKKVIALILVASLVMPHQTASARTFTKEQKRIVERLAEICASEWDTYGVLPSVCVAQAFVESTLGEHCSGNNLWGIASGAESYSNIEEGTYRYLQVINNGCYDGAPGCRDYAKQIRRILDGGYCQPEGHYYSNVLWTIRTYNLSKYDEEMFDSIRKKTEQKEKQNRQKKWEQEYTMVYDESVPAHSVSVDSSIIKEGAVCIYYDYVLQGIYDVQSGQKGYKIGTSDETLVGKIVILDVKEGAKG